MTAPSRAAVARTRRDAYTRQANARLFRIVRWLFVVGGTMPWWLPALRGTVGQHAAWLRIIGRVLDGPFIVICHRMPERSLAVASYYMPLCSRCSGIFTGLALGALLAWPRPSLHRTRLGILVTGLLMVADVVSQDLGWHPMWHATRLLTGAALGFVLSVGLLAAIARNTVSHQGRQPT